MSDGDLSRRRLVQAALWTVPLVVGSRALAAPTAPDAQGRAARFAEIERLHGGRLGVCVIDTGTSVKIGHRSDERFAMCSTFKLLLASFILARVDRGDERLDRSLPVTQADLVSHSPVTLKRVGAKMTLAELCHATMTTSDNAAANLLLTASGGPSALTTFARSLGDPVTRLDRNEPEMNIVRLDQGDERDTTTPAAMAGLMQRLVVGSALLPPSRAILVGWMRETVTGLARLRAGFPADWNAGDKTGTGLDGPTNDIAVGWPPGRGALIVTAYYDRPGRSMDENSLVLAEVGRAVAALTEP